MIRENPWIDLTGARTYTLWQTDYLVNWSVATEEMVAPCVSVVAATHKADILLQSIGVAVKDNPASSRCDICDRMRSASLLKCKPLIRTFVTVY